MISLTNQSIKKEAQNCDFSFCGIAKPETFTQEKIRFENAIKNGYHANMGYLERDIDARFNPEHLLPGCQSVVVLLFNYFTGKSLNSSYKISKYAFVQDYHHLVSTQIEKMVANLKSNGAQFNYAISVDSGKISEKNWAIKAGLGNYGKNGLLLTPKGSYFFIGLLLLDQKMDFYDQNEPNSIPTCGNCTLCIDNCPTQAIVKPYVIDAKRCLSYQTLSNKTPDYDLVKEHPWIYGCDVCQEVCPKNKKSEINDFAVTNSSLFLHFEDSDFENLSKEEFDRYFSNTSIGSKGFEKLFQFIKNRQK